MSNALAGKNVFKTADSNPIFLCVQTSLERPVTLSFKCTFSLTYCLQIMA